MCTEMDIMENSKELYLLISKDKTHIQRWSIRVIPVERPFPHDTYTNTRPFTVCC